MIQRAEIVSVELCGEYDYRCLYEILMRDGGRLPRMIDYHTVKWSAEKHNDPWAVSLLEIIRPLQRGWEDANGIGVR